MFIKESSQSERARRRCKCGKFLFFHRLLCCSYYSGLHTLISSATSLWEGPYVGWCVEPGMRILQGEFDIASRLVVGENAASDQIGESTRAQAVTGVCGYICGRHLQHTPVAESQGWFRSSRIAGASIVVRQPHSVRWFSACALISLLLNTITAATFTTTPIAVITNTNEMNITWLLRFWLLP